MGRKIGTLCMILGAALILAALSLFLWNQWEDQQADAAASDALTQLQQQMVATPETADADPYSSEMKEVMIDGYSYIGTVSIPSQNLTLPVMSSWSYPQLKIAPCRYSGSTKTNNLVIAGHNYTRHFGPIENMVPGDAVYFTDMDGIVTSYEVTEIDTLNPTDIEEMTDSGYDLTLFTCTYSGQSRITVRCSRVDR